MSRSLRATVILGSVIAVVGCAGSTASDAGSGGAEAATATGGRTSTGAVSSTGGVSESPCPAGTERCICYGNGTCNAGLVRGSNLCVALGADGGATGFGGAGGNATGGTATGGSATGGGGSVLCVKGAAAAFYA